MCAGCQPLSLSSCPSFILLLTKRAAHATAAVCFVNTLTIRGDCSLTVLSKLFHVALLHRILYYILCSVSMTFPYANFNVVHFLCEWFYLLYLLIFMFSVSIVWLLIGSDLFQISSCYAHGFTYSIGGKAEMLQDKLLIDMWGKWNIKAAKWNSVTMRTWKMSETRGNSPDIFLFYCCRHSMFYCIVLIKDHAEVQTQATTFTKICLYGFNFKYYFVKYYYSFCSCSFSSTLL